jgi:hypothetical protein
MFTSEVRIRETEGTLLLFVVTNAGRGACARAIARTGLRPLVEAIRAFADPTRTAGGNGFEIRLRPGVGRDRARELAERLNDADAEQFDGPR